mgnify:CR=1 FL=1
MEYQRKNRLIRERNITKPTTTETQNKIRSCLSKEFTGKAPPDDMSGHSMTMQREGETNGEAQVSPIPSYRPKPAMDGSDRPEAEFPPASS